MTDFTTEELMKEFKLGEEFKSKLDSFIEQIKTAYSNSVLKTDKPIILVGGNGGSASQADHLVGELIGSFNDIEVPIPAISLSSNTAVLTALSNDYSYEMAYSRVVQAFGTKGSIFIGLSTSGESKNIINSLFVANSKGMETFSITGGSENTVAGESKFNLPIKGSTQTVQEQTLVALHLIAKALKELEANYQEVYEDREIDMSVTLPTLGFIVN